MVNDDKYPERIVTQVPLKARASELLNGIRNDTGVSKVEAIQRIFEWFLGLDRKLRLAILNKDVETQRELVRLVLSDMAGDESLKTEVGPLDTLSLDQLLALQHKITDQIGKMGQNLSRELKKRSK